MCTVIPGHTLDYDIVLVCSTACSLCQCMQVGMSLVLNVIAATLCMIVLTSYIQCSYSEHVRILLTGCTCKSLLLY